ncbi:MAG: hypothetical protein H6557_17460 [Lewinellaceae bacterium]|nr:hypothetical protein [Phaeodactylibacter sp.]MCB9038405.1 hypothetical protein [Lewinellaceae bacterium]
MNRSFYAMLLFAALLLAQTAAAQTAEDYRKKPGATYLITLDDARLDIGLKTVSVFALDDKAPLTANPHYRAMWNLIKLGASLESLLQGMDEPINDLSMDRRFGQNGYNKTVLSFFIRYGFGESSDVEMQRQFFELAVSPGYFKQGRKGMNLHLDYRFNVANTRYGAGANSIARAFDYEIFVGARAGFDWSFQRSEGEAGFFSHLNEEIKRIAEENEFTVAQLLSLERLAEDSKVLLPEDVGGRSFHLGPIAGARLSKRLFANGQVFLSSQAFYDVMDLVNTTKDVENMRSQHHISISLGLSLAIGGEGRGMVSFY